MKNNKGFSLVELIVVIAIMAVLVGFLAPQFLRYVDKARMSIDIQNVTLLCHTVETYAADVTRHGNEIPAQSTIELYRTSHAVDPENVSADSQYWEYSLENAGITDYYLRSDSWFADPSQPIVITAYELNGMPYFEESNVKEGLSILKGDRYTDDE